MKLIALLVLMLAAGCGEQVNDEFCDPVLCDCGCRTSPAELRGECSWNQCLCLGWDQYSDDHDGRPCPDGLCVEDCSVFYSQ
jgi:hypothetical protein